MTDTTELEFMTPADFLSKVEYEGGVMEALEYGLHATDLDADDDASSTLRAAWARLEDVYRDHMAPAVSAVESALNGIEDAEEQDDPAEVNG